MIVHLSEHAGLYVLVALALGVLSSVAAVVLLVKLRAAVRPFSRVRARDGDAAEILQSVLQTTEQTDAGMSALDSKLETHIENSRSFTKHVGLVRYDAFDDVAGKQSYSMCMLNEDRDGVLITYLFSKKSTRSYAVTIDKGKPSRELSEEEARAMDGALSNQVLVHS
jgi:hypothetical protein